jgi:hypothetical protein
MSSLRSLHSSVNDPLLDPWSIMCLLFRIAQSLALHESPVGDKGPFSGFELDFL